MSRSGLGTAETADLGPETAGQTLKIKHPTIPKRFFYLFLNFQPSAVSQPLLFVGPTSPNESPHRFLKPLQHYAGDLYRSQPQVVSPNG